MFTLPESIRFKYNKEKKVLTASMCADKAGVVEIQSPIIAEWKKDSEVTQEEIGRIIRAISRTFVFYQSNMRSSGPEIHFSDAIL